MNNAAILLIARILLAAIFILAGLNKFGNIAGTAGYISSVGLPMGVFLAWATAIFEVVAGIALVIGFQTKLVSLGTCRILCRFRTDLPQQSRRPDAVHSVHEKLCNGRGLPGAFRGRCGRTFR